MKIVGKSEMRKSGELQEFSRCCRCFSEIYRGEFCLIGADRIYCLDCGQGTSGVRLGQLSRGRFQ